jgi:transcriptional regulator GlxA family with amidase domain
LREAAVNAIKHPIKRSLVFFLVPDFTMIAFATALDPLRSANRMLGYEAYR